MESGREMKTEMTTEVNVYRQQERKIRCVKNQYDYLGDGSTVKTEPLIPGQEYTFVRGESESYGEMVHIAEIPRLYGFAESLFEEIEPYDAELLRKAREKWLLSTLQKSEACSADECLPVDECFKQIRQQMERRSHNTIETERLLLWPSDEDRDLWFYHKHLREDGDFELFSGLPYSKENIQLMRLIGGLYFTVVLKESHIMIGYVAYQEDSGEAEFYIFKDWRRQGYGKEALTALMNSVFAGKLLAGDENGVGHQVSAEVIAADTLARNDVAIRFMKSCGFREKQDCAVMFKALFREGEVKDSDDATLMQPISYFEISGKDLEKVW